MGISPDLGVQCPKGPAHSDLLLTGNFFMMSFATNSRCRRAFLVLGMLFLISASCSGGGKALSLNTEPYLDKDTPRLLQLAQNYLSQGKGEAATNLLETVLQLNPGDARTHLYLGQSYALMKNYDRARIEFVQCLKSKQSDVAQLANQAIGLLPKRLLLPKQIGSLASTTLPESKDKAILLVCCASWQDNYQALKEAVSGMSDSPKLATKLIEVDNPVYEPVIDLYKITTVPTVILLSKGDKHILNAKIGALEANDLKRQAHEFTKSL
jgi:thioredoxin-like negative regulator of GroEL